MVVLANIFKLYYPLNHHGLYLAAMCLGLIFIAVIFSSHTMQKGKKDKAKKASSRQGPASDVTRTNYPGKLEKLILEQTTELRSINRQLQAEINERKKIEENLHQAKDYAVSLINSSIDMIIATNTNGMIMEYNKAAEQKMGYTKDEVIGQPATILYASEEERSRVQKSLRESGSFRGEIQNRRKDGTLFYSYLSASMMYDNKGDYAGVMGISRDITERKIAEEKLKLYATELERSNKELQQFAYVASHDLQEPLRMVTSYLQLIERKYKDRLDEKAEKFIDYAVDGAKRMYNLINDLLAYSRVSTHAQPAQSTNCQEVLDQVLTNLAATVKESGVKITHDPLPTVTVDATQLAQLLQNLISNAIKFRDQDAPAIHVSCQSVDGEWQFSVEDNGIGIAPKNIHRIFNIFQRLHTTAEYPGTGIGLAICKKIAERHGGQIWVESEPGQGTTFYFTIPETPES